MAYIFVLLHINVETKQWKTEEKEEPRKKNLDEKQKKEEKGSSYLWESYGDNIVRRIHGIGFIESFLIKFTYTKHFQSNSSWWKRYQNVISMNISSNICTNIVPINTHCQYKICTVKMITAK